MTARIDYYLYRVLKGRGVQGEGVEPWGTVRIPAGKIGNLGGTLGESPPPLKNPIILGSGIPTTKPATGIQGRISHPKVFWSSNGLKFNHQLQDGPLPAINGVIGYI